MQHGQYPEVPDDFGHWLAGFIDGEGCFSITYCRRPNGLTYSCVFAIGIRLDDLRVLEQIRDTLGVGRIHYRPRPSAPWNTKPLADFQVGARAECARVVEVLTRFPLRAKKARDFEIWQEAVSVWGQIRQPGIGGVNAAIWQRMAELKAMLSEIRVYHDSVLVPVPVEANAIASGDDMVLF